MKKYKLFITIIFGILALNITLAFNVNSISNSKHDPVYTPDLLPVGTAVSDFTLRDLFTDIDISFSSFAGKVVLLDFFVPYSNSVNLTREHLVDTINHYSASQFVILSIDIDPITSTEDDVEAFAIDRDMDWYVFQDIQGDVVSYFEIQYAPTFYIIDQNQEIYWRENIIVDYNFLTGKIDEIIDDVNTNTNTNGGGEIPEFWQQNWYWFLIGGILFIVVIGLVIQRQVIVRHNRKVQEQKKELQMKKRRRRKR